MNITNKPVINAVFATFVYFNDTVCRIKPKKRNIPINVPDKMLPFVRFFFFIPKINNAAIIAMRNRNDTKRYSEQ